MHQCCPKCGSVRLMSSSELAKEERYHRTVEAITVVLCGVVLGFAAIFVVGFAVWMWV